MNNGKSHEAKICTLFVLILVVVAVQALIGLVIYRWFPEWAARGQFGDMFGAVNTLFSGLAFAGVVYAILLQRRELGLQRDELTLTRGSLEESAQAQKKLAYFQFYEIIVRHHSEELTELRRAIREDFPPKAQEAQQKNIPLRDLDKALHLKVSTLANYYESLGMFLQNGWKIFPEEARTTMLEMLHNSVSEHWPTIDRYRVLIHPSPPPDWAESFKWLYEKVIDYRSTRFLD